MKTYECLAQTPFNPLQQSTINPPSTPSLPDNRAVQSPHLKNNKTHKLFTPKDPNEYLEISQAVHSYPILHTTDSSSSRYTPRTIMIITGQSRRRKRHIKPLGLLITTHYKPYPNHPSPASRTVLPLIILHDTRGYNPSKSPCGPALHRWASMHS